MALFGAPAAQEDHAHRACHAAWQLTRAVASYAENLRKLHGVDFHVRLGINSGEVVVGRIGTNIRLDPTALGHTVGLAQRMEALAEPGRVYLTEHTARLVKGWFRLIDLGLMTVKGAREPLQVFLLDGPRPSPSSVGGDRILGRAPLVGRQRELAALEDALAAATEGHAQIVGVVGEAGVGKSRLCEEFARSTTARGMTVRRTTGVSHGREVPLLPILSLLRDYFSITEEDDPGQAREKIARRLLDLDPGLEYRFWHPLTQEVAYRSRLSDRRARLHSAVAKALIAHDHARSDERAGVLAWHWERASQKLEAARWNVRAGTWAVRTDITEARRRWRVAIDLLKEIDEDTEGLELNVRAHIRLLQFGARTGIATEEADRLYIEGRALAERLGDPGLQGMIVMASAAARHWSGDIAGAWVLAWEASQLADVSDDAEVKVALWLGIPISVSCGRGPLPLGFDRIEYLLTVCNGNLDLGSALMGYSPYARALQVRAGILTRMGLLEQARRDAEKAIALSRRRGDPDTLSWALALLPHLTWLSGEFDDVEAPPWRQLASARRPATWLAWYLVARLSP